MSRQFCSMPDSWWQGSAPAPRDSELCLPLQLLLVINSSSSSSSSSSFPSSPCPRQPLASQGLPSPSIYGGHECLLSVLPDVHHTGGPSPEACHALVRQTFAKPPALIHIHMHVDERGGDRETQSRVSRLKYHVCIKGAIRLLEEDYPRFLPPKHCPRASPSSLLLPPIPAPLLTLS